MKHSLTTLVGESRMKRSLITIVIWALLIAGGMLIASWLVEKAAAHVKTTCTHTTVYSYSDGDYWKAVHYGIYGNLLYVHDHSHKHYVRVCHPDSGCWWVYKHLRVTVGCQGH